MRVDVLCVLVTFPPRPRFYSWLLNNLYGMNLKSDYLGPGLLSCSEQTCDLSPHARCRTRMDIVLESARRFSMLKIV